MDCYRLIRISPLCFLFCYRFFLYNFEGKGNNNKSNILNIFLNKKLTNAESRMHSETVYLFRSTSRFIFRTVSRYVSVTAGEKLKVIYLWRNDFLI